MKLAIDYDGTYTLDPDLWDGFIAQAQAKGHEFICVTNRAFAPSGPLPLVPLLCAGVEYKEAYAELCGHSVDVWIDDIPGTIQPGVSLP